MRGDNVRALRLAAACKRRYKRGTLGIPSPLELSFDDFAEELRASTDEELYESEWAAGSALTDDEAVAYALEPRDKP